MIYNTLNKTIFLRASTEQVWAYLTDPDKLGLWFHKPKAPLVQGETYAMFATQSGDKLMWGYVTRAQPHGLLEYTFIITPMGDATSTVK